MVFTHCKFSLIWIYFFLDHSCHDFRCFMLCYIIINFHSIKCSLQDYSIKLERDKMISTAFKISVGNGFNVAKESHTFGVAFLLLEGFFLSIKPIKVANDYMWKSENKKPPHYIFNEPMLPWGQKLLQVTSGTHARKGKKIIQKVKNETWLYTTFSCFPEKCGTRYYPILPFADIKDRTACILWMIFVPYKRQKKLAVYDPIFVQIKIYSLLRLTSILYFFTRPSFALQVIQKNYADCSSADAKKMCFAICTSSLTAQLTSFDVASMKYNGRWF